MHQLNKNRFKDLCDLSLKESAEVFAVTGDPVQALRLEENGFTPGSPVTLLQKTPFGDPLIFEIRGTRIALRKNEARCIVIK